MIEQTESAMLQLMKAREEKQEELTPSTLLTFWLDFDGCHEHSDTVFEYLCNIIDEHLNTSTPIIHLYNASFRQSLGNELFNMFWNGNGSAFARLQKLETRLKEKYNNRIPSENIQFIQISVVDHLLGLDEGTTINNALELNILDTLDSTFIRNHDRSFQDDIKSAYSQNKTFEEKKSDILDIIARYSSNLQIETLDKRTIHTWLEPFSSDRDQLNDVNNDKSKVTIFATCFFEAYKFITDEITHIEHHYFDDKYNLITNFHLFFEKLAPLISENIHFQGHQLYPQYRKIYINHNRISGISESTSSSMAEYISKNDTRTFVTSLHDYYARPSPTYNATEILVHHKTRIPLSYSIINALIHIKNKLIVPDEIDKSLNIKIKIKEYMANLFKDLGEDLEQQSSNIEDIYLPYLSHCFNNDIDSFFNEIVNINNLNTLKHILNHFYQKSHHHISEVKNNYQTIQSLLKFSDKIHELNMQSKDEISSLLQLLFLFLSQLPLNDQAIFFVYYQIQFSPIGSFYNTWTASILQHLFKHKTKILLSNHNELSDDRLIKLIIANTKHDTGLKIININEPRQLEEMSLQEQMNYHLSDIFSLGSYSPEEKMTENYSHIELIMDRPRVFTHIFLSQISEIIDEPDIDDHSDEPWLYDENEYSFLEYYENSPENVLYSYRENFNDEPPIGPYLGKFMIYICTLDNTCFTLMLNQLIEITQCLETSLQDYLLFDQNDIHRLFICTDEEGNTFGNLIQHQLTETENDEEKKRLQKLLLHDLPFFQPFVSNEPSEILPKLGKDSTSHIAAILG